MFDGSFGIGLIFLTTLVLVSLPFVNHFYQKRANDYVDNLLKDNPVEYNKQIRGNAYRYLISRGLFGLFFLSGIYNIWSVELRIVYYKIAFFLIGIGLIVWGIWSYKRELKKIKELI